MVFATFGFYLTIWFSKPAHRKAVSRCASFMKIRIQNNCHQKMKLTISIFLVITTISCGVCFPSNLEFKNITLFNPEVLRSIDINSEYRQTSAYEATRNLSKVINEPRTPSNIIIKFQPNGFITADLWSFNNKNQQGIIYSKKGSLFIDKIRADQDRCKFIETYKIRLEKNKIILIQYGGITNQKMVYEYSKVE